VGTIGRLLTKKAEETDIVNFSPLCPTIQSGSLRFRSLPAGSAAGSSAGISFTHGTILGFFAPQGRPVARIKVKFGREEGTVGPLLPAKFDLDRFRDGGLRPPKLKKKSNFTNIIGPKGRVPCTIFTKFTSFMSFMRVLSLHNSAKYGCLFR